MTTSSSTASSRKKTLLLAAAGLLLILIIGGVWLVTRPDPAQQVTSALPGEAVSPTDQPMESTLGKAMAVELRGHALQPKHVAFTEMTIAKADWGVGVVLWQWDASTEKYKDYRKWSTEVVNQEAREYRIHVSPFEKECTGLKNNNCKDVIRYYYLAVLNASKDEGADVITVTDKGGDNHIWQFIDAGVVGGVQYYQIKNKNSGMCLTIAAGSASNGGQLVQVTCNAAYDTQLWRAFKHQ